MKIQRITPDKVQEIIDTRKPKGLFICKSGNLYTGIDNTTGAAWCEDFITYTGCMKYLNDKACKLNRKKKKRLRKRAEQIAGFTAAVLAFLGVSLMVALLIFAPVLQQALYYLLLAFGVGGLTAGLFIYLIVFGELKDGTSN